MEESELRHLRGIGISTSLVASLLLSWASTATATEDAKPLYSNLCAQCHGEDGRGDTPAGRAMELSSIAGTEESVTLSLVRQDPRHRSASKALTDAELAAIAALVAGL